MAFIQNSPHQFGFYTGQAGFVLSDFNVDIFTVNGNPVDSTVSSSLALTDLGNGYYYASYTPDDVGLYILALSQTMPLVLNFIDVADIEEANFVLLTQNTPTTNALKATIPISPLAQGVINQNTDLTQYLLMVFRSQDWQVGRKTSDWAVASTELDKNGNWLVTPLTVLPDTYHIVIRNNAGVEKVIKAFLEV